MTNRLLDIGEKAVKLAEKMGAEQVEVFLAKSRAYQIEAENNAIKGASEQRDAGIGIRTVIVKKIGFAYVTTLDESDIKEAIANSLHLAKASLSDPDFVTLPSSGGTYHKAKNLFDKKVDMLSSEKAADLLIRTINATKENLKGMDYAIESAISSSSTSNVIVNNLGIAMAESRTSVSLYSYPVIKEGDDQTASYEYQISRDLDDIDPEYIGARAATLALGFLRPKTIESGEMPVIFAPLGASSILGRGFAGAVNAEEIQMGRSYISDAFGECIASESLEIIDDGTIPGGLGTRTFDAEGYVSQKTPIIESGVLKNLLHNSYTANKDNVDNTGNAARPSYSGLPRISTSNFILTPGKGTLDDFISEMKKGIVCRNTGDRPNMTTGDLSAMVMEGYYVENGEIQHPLKNTLIGINMKDLLMRVSQVGSDSRPTFSMITPSFLIERANITSG
ncbi:MAG: TldD/PmbA family protein [Candidatus Thorarchaeota archaeon]|nr:MAG: TldD/PmbA family protein [Candidatus Thorarchaeota archaeon]